ncbi:MAG: Fe-S cluster assembly protein SufD [Xanthomonadales bacterium]|nr:Fe-S cluster assembly protein SufD [Xanthomonadales bacterium]NNL94527.1 Fe-S cluster assembly protein SufD [Xanthomonadales bacterium]
MNRQSSLSTQDFLAHSVVRSGDPSWLNTLRQSASDRFLGLPGRKTEQWKYTAVAAQSVRATADDADTFEPRVPQPLIDTDAKVVLINGDVSEMPGENRDGLCVKPLAAALQEADQPLVDLLESLPIDGRQHAFSQLNTAALGQGLYIHVAAGIDAGELLLQWPCGAEEMNHARICVVLETGARLHLVEQFENGSQHPAKLNLVEQIELGEGAELFHSRLQHYPAESLLIGRTEVRHGTSTRYSFTGMDLGAGLARHDVRSEFAGEGAGCSLNAAVLGSGDAHVDYHFEADHQAMNCQSGQLFRAVAGDRSKIVFNGRVHVAPGADGSDSQQSSAGLLLSRKAEIDAKPELEILADEVVAAHGATVGQLDQAAMFYLRSRGISEEQGRKMLTLAFCRSVIDRVPHEALHESLAMRLTTAMDELESGHE